MEEEEEEEEDKVNKARETFCLVFVPVSFGYVCTSTSNERASNRSSNYETDDR